MSVAYTPVQWNLNKVFYDVVLAIIVAAYVLIYVRYAPQFLDHARPIDGAILRAQAFGTCAFFMLTAILCIGPLARLDTRFLPLLYNRRHFGVLTFFVALSHVMFVLNWYFAFSPTPKLEALLGANTSYTALLGFPFEALGIIALLSLAVLAATSHDFWLSFLGPRLWKTLHLSVYIAYAALVGHVALGALQSHETQTFTIAVIVCTGLVCALHAAAAFAELRRDATARAADGDWVEVGSVSEIAEGRAKIVRLGDGSRVAVFRHKGRLSAISNACAHQNGPLGEGRVIGGCVTCPWHGFQYRLADGCSPKPFTEKVPTYRLKLDGTIVFVDANANPPGTRVEPVPVPGAGETSAVVQSTGPSADAAATHAEVAR
ncbi:MAG: Rieske 2Fe-2S domain-containing protein [Pseudomonadota bacterium]